MERIARLVKWIAVGSGVCLAISLAFSFVSGLAFWFFGNLAMLGFIVAALLTMVLLAFWLGDQYKQSQARS